LQGGETVKAKGSVLLLLVCALFAGFGQGGYGDRYAIPGDGQALLASGGSIESGFASVLPGLPAAEIARPSRDGDDEAAPGVAPSALSQAVASSVLSNSPYSAPVADPFEFHPPVRGPPAA